MQFAPFTDGAGKLAASARELAENAPTLAPLPSRNTTCVGRVPRSAPGR